VVNDSESDNTNLKEENCATSVSDSAWSKVEHTPTDDLFHGNTGFKQLLN